MKELPSIYLPTKLPDLRLLNSISKQSGLPEYQHQVDFLIYIDGVPFIIPKGDITDLASIPWLFRSLFHPANPRYAAAASLHDILYKAELCKRTQADLAFKAVLLSCGVDLNEAETMYSAVYYFGWTTYRKHTKKTVLEARGEFGITDSKRPLFNSLADLQKLWEIAPYYKERKIVNNEILLRR